MSDENTNDMFTMLHPWLIYQSSMRLRLEKNAGHAALTVLNQQFKTVGWWDRFFLNQPSGMIFQRNILMYAHQYPCWHARTLIPQTCYDLYQSLFHQLNDKPLGDLIFNDPRIVRESLVNYAINPNHIEYYWLNAEFRGNDERWVRLSTFSIEKKELFFLIEILLPDLSRFKS